MIYYQRDFIHHSLKLLGENNQYDKLTNMASQRYLCGIHKTKLGANDIKADEGK